MRHTRVMFSKEATEAHERLIERASLARGEGDESDAEVVAPLIAAIDAAVTTLDDKQMGELLMLLVHDAAQVHDIRTAPQPASYTRMREALLSDSHASDRIPADDYV